MDSWWILVGMSMTWSKMIKHVSQDFGRIPGGFLVDSWWSLVGMCINSTKINQDFDRIPGIFLVDFGRNEY